MSAHTWTPDEDALIVPSLGRRIRPTVIENIAAWLGCHRAQVRRRRRALRQLMKRGR